MEPRPARPHTARTHRSQLQPTVDRATSRYSSTQLYRIVPNIRTPIPDMLCDHTRRRARSSDQPAVLCSAAPDAAHPVVRSACRLQLQGLRTLQRPPAREYSTPDTDSIHSFQCTQPSCLHALMPGRVLAPTDAAGSPDARLSTTWAPLLYDPLLYNNSHYSVVGSGATGRITSAVSSETTKEGPSAVSSVSRKAHGLM